MTQHTRLTITRVVQHLLRYPSALSHRVLAKVIGAAWEAGYRAGQRANAS